MYTKCRGEITLKPTRPLYTTLIMVDKDTGEILNKKRCASREEARKLMREINSNPDSAIWTYITCE